jgi:homeobox protein cut-like
MGGNVGGGVMSMGATVFPFLPVASYIHTAPGHMAPVMMAVDFRPFFGQQHQQHQLPPVSNAMPLALTTNKAEPQQPSTTTTTTGADVGGASLTPSLLNCSSTDEIDTQELTASVRDVLQAHGLGQKLFGEAVLELSQGSVSELLAKPKPWALLSAKGREPFLRMRSWLNDPQGIDRLRAYQSQACLGILCEYCLWNIDSFGIGGY